MEDKLKKFKNNRKAQYAVCMVRGVIGEAILAGLALAYVAEHIDKVPHQAGLGVGVVIVGLLLYFTHANKIK